jgi:amino acid adenylation domain-containing protein
MTGGEEQTHRLVSVDFDPFAQGEVVTMAPATKSQREIWAAVQMEPVASLAFNESFSLRLHGPLDVNRFRDAFHRVLGRHGSLRSTFTPDGVWSCTSTAMPSVLPLMDLTALGPEEQGQRLEDEARREVTTPFDLVRGPLLRSQLYRLSAHEHVFFFTAHHIVCDGWSQAVVLSELADLYSGRDVPEAPSFAEYATGEIDGREDEAYWLSRFADSAPVLELPVDRPRPRVRSYDAAREDLVLPADLVNDLQKLGARHGAGRFATFLAGYAALLHRWTGQEDLVIGVPASGQARTGRDHLVGHCTSLLPVRLAVSPHQPFGDLLSSVRASFLDALDHQRPSFGRVLECLRLARNPSRIPLVSTVFKMDRSAEKLDFVDLDVNYAPHPRHYEIFELFLNASLANGRFVLAAQYNTNLFEAATIRRRLLGLQTMLSAAVADADQKVARLPILPEGEREKIVVDFNRTTVNFYSPASLHQLFEKQADQTPERIAVRSGNAFLTYAALEEQSNRLAHRLRALGVTPNSLVGVCAERSLEMVVALYGVLKAGAGFLPLEPDDPAERLAFFLSDAKPGALVAQAGVADRLPPSSIPVLAIGRESQGQHEIASHRLPCVTGPDDLAYVIYTSGSTGRPKGVANLHKGILNRILWMTDRFGAAHDQRVLQKTPFTFDVSLWELFWPLTSGGCLVLAPPHAHRDPARLAAIIAEQQITMLHFVPSMLHAFLEHVDPKGLPSVRRVLCSGEALSFDLQERFFQRWGVELHNLYGPTEAAVEVTHWRCVPGDARGIVPIGHALANTRLYVVDSEGQPTPIGVPGELLIGGVQVARGYLDRPELDAEHFVPDGFSTEPGARLYRTGDRARLLEGGELEFLGRLDDQVKVRGLRIEPGEIEAVLAAHPAVRQAVLRVFEPKPGDQRIVAFTIPTPNQEVSAAELREYLCNRLPDIMIPQQFVSLPHWPLTPGGKIDRKALSLPAEPGEEGERVAPHTPAERFLAELWADLIGSAPESISCTDHFFDVGGHSLLALQAISRIQGRTHVHLEPRVLLLSSLGQIASMLAADASGTLPHHPAHPTERS